FLPSKLGQTVNGAHLIGLPQQLAQRRHLSIDGGVAVTAGAKFADQFVEHVLAECAEAPAQKQLFESPMKKVTLYLCLPGSHRMSPNLSNSSLRLNSVTTCSSGLP